MTCYISIPFVQITVSTNKKPMHDMFFNIFRYNNFLKELIRLSKNYKSRMILHEEIQETYAQQETRAAAGLQAAACKLVVLQSSS